MSGQMGKMMSMIGTDQFGGAKKRAQQEMKMGTSMSGMGSNMGSNMGGMPYGSQDMTRGADMQQGMGNGRQYQDPAVNSADMSQPEPIDWAGMGDDDLEKRMYGDAFSGEGMDFENMDEAQKKRYIEYLTKDGPKKDPGLSPMAFSAVKGKDASRPMGGGLQGLMSMALYGKPAQGGPKKGLMGV